MQSLQPSSAGRSTSELEDLARVGRQNLVPSESGRKRRIPMNEMAANPTHRGSGTVNKLSRAANDSVKNSIEDETSIDLKVYERGSSNNKVLQDILKRLYRQYSELFRRADEAPLWNNQGSSNAEDLRAVIQNLLKALYLPLPGHPLRLRTMDRLVTCLKTQYQYCGNHPRDFKEAILYLKGAVLLCPDGSPTRPYVLKRLGNNLMVWFTQRGGKDYLMGAISYYRKALEAVPPTDPRSERAEIMSGLGSCLQALYRENGRIQHLDEAMKWLRMAKSCPLPADHHPRIDILNNLALGLESRHHLYNRSEDNNEAIRCLREALSLKPDHLRMADVTHNLAFYLQTRYHQLGDLQDLKEAIDLLRRIVDIHPPGHPTRSRYLVSLSGCLRTWHTLYGGFEETDEAIQHLRDVLSVSPPTAPQRPRLE
ncbi:hypothetical protein FRC02_003646 [Tulasnella sp. 418]|nr:hypothetical protein FRC02_003646 [Tulasnella sp. 418]